MNQATDETASQTNTRFPFKSLEALRAKLLDLTARNKLLNFNFAKTNSLRLVDELPDQVAAHLTVGGKFTFLPVPEPTETELIREGFLGRNEEGQLVELKEYPTPEQWAKVLGIQASYDLPDATTVNESKGHHNDDGLQTLLWPPVLDATLRGLRSKAETSIEESGANILYLALGFLEWTEDDNSSRKYMAPLFTMPVSLERSSSADNNGVFRSSITLKDDGILSNLTLREKLKQDFGLHLPELHEDSTPEAYFDSLSKTLLKQKPKWRLRRQASLSLLNFTKQAMYEDLDPDNWPENAPFEQHAIIAHLFGSSTDAESSVGGFSYAEEHAIDEIKDVHKRFPIIYDADSSQHSALIDAVNGENLVIEGPPGSGKSQTITNLIAANIANGKRVLFVAEKMAALNVVKDRLDRAGLGDFCLELHSHTANKAQLLQAIGERLNKRRYKAPKDIETDIERLEAHRRDLTEYADLINSPWKQTGRTIHEILSAATRLRNELKIDPDSLSIDGLDGTVLTPSYSKKLADDAELLANIYDQAADQAKDGQLENHHWFGVNNTELIAHQEDRLVIALRDWTDRLIDLQQSSASASDELEFALDNQLPLIEIRKLCEMVPCLPPLLGREPLEHIEEALQKVVTLTEAVASIAQLHSVYREYGARITADVWSDPQALSGVKAALVRAKTVGLSNSKTIGFLLERFASLSGLSTRSERLTTRLRNVTERLPAELLPWLTPSPQGLAEIQAFSNLAKGLPSHLWRYRDPVFDNPDIDELLEQITCHLKPMVSLHAKVNGAFELSNLPEASQLISAQEVLATGGLFKWFSPTWRATRKSILDLTRPTHRRGKTLKLLPDLIAFVQELEHVEALNKRDNALDAYLDGPDTPIDEINTVRGWYRTVRDCYGHGFGERAKLAEILFAIDRDTALQFADYVLNDLASDIEQVLIGVQQYRGDLPELPDLKSEHQPIIQITQAIKETLSSVLEPLNAAIASDQESLAGANQLAIVIERQQELLADLADPEMARAISLLGLSLEVGSLTVSQKASAENFVAILNILQDSPPLAHSLVSKPDSERYQRICDKWPTVIDALSCADSSWQAFQVEGEVSVDDWTASSQGMLVPLIARCERAISHPKWLTTWLDYLRLRNRLSTAGLNSMIKGLERKHYTTEQLPDILQLAVSYQISSEIFHESEQVRKANGMELNAVRDQFKKYDERIMTLQREMVAHRASQVSPPEGKASGKVGDYTELGLIRHNLNLQRPRISVRSLMTRAGKSMQLLKPCFMMSPMSVAQYLVPGQHEFDLVVMDEASQIRPEDALGAIARGNSLIVVGDPKQLPPTSFFQRVADGVGDSDDDDTVGLQQSQSILDSVMPMFNNRRLRWHYRSRHESLIAFSNQRFYNSDLILFPSPFAEDSEFGVKFRRVRSGRFHGKKNVEEARAIVDAAVRQLIANPHESLGLVAMNATQSEEIEMQLDQRLRDDPIARDAFERNRELDEPLFIKNLENVQGDERDVIMISMTYGPTEAGSNVMPQRFGPINQDVGWRRLNVLFTRSKKRMVIFSSMDSGHVCPTERSSRGVKSLQAFLEYCETGRVPQVAHTGRGADNDFELAVMQMLAKHGYACEPQLGVAGYFLDLAVRDPGMPGRFLMGIECDGATYHSAKSARDRDRLRQAVLEGLGWRIRRIWSTDWFKHPEAQLAPILEELAGLAAPVAQKEMSERQPLQVETERELLELPDYMPSQGDAGSNLSLIERLKRYDREVIRIKHPNVQPDRRLLRPEMLEVLLRVQPESKGEFREKVPSFLRTGTAAEDAEFLDNVLELIALYSS